MTKSKVKPGRARGYSFTVGETVEGDTTHPLYHVPLIYLPSHLAPPLILTLTYNYPLHLPLTSTPVPLICPLRLGLYGGDEVMDVWFTATIDHIIPLERAAGA